MIEVLGYVLLPVGIFLIFAQPIVGVWLISATIPVQNLNIFSEGITLTRILGIGVSGLWIGHKVLHRESWKSMLDAGVFKGGMILLALAFASGLWARYPDATYEYVFQLFNLFLWCLLVIDTMNSWSRIEWLAKILTLVAVVASILTITQYFNEGVRRAGADIAGGVNATAEVLVTLIPFAFYLLYAPQSRKWRLVGLASVILSSLAVVVTVSRTGFMLLIVAVVFQYWSSFKNRTGGIWIFILAGIFFVVVNQSISQARLMGYFTYRMQSIVPELQTAYNTDGIMGARIYHARVGLAIFLNHPLFGVGYGNYGYYFLHTYQFRVPGSGKLYTSPRSPHGSYIGMLANLGLLGFLIWLAIIIVAFKNLYRSRSLWAETKHEKEYLLVHAITASFLLQTLYGIASNTNENKIYWLLLGLSAAVWHLSKDKQGPTDHFIQSPKNFRRTDRDSFTKLPSRESSKYLKSQRF